ncbi:hypothetical protein JFL43_08555 [Viridibacillus sp. YIM B01967]|uniref:Uncharacterized protein n=1 Tax=Viridibacillus soli TaxID=2798301 RepID=A0ABS1H683_9BACL|nr:hypothetical protein [Viridibacillus soli]MBK3494911.1 hypothetical protein [Viridibacillus soli]
MKKGCVYMGTRPLLFIKAPPAFFIDIENTSVFQIVAEAVVEENIEEVIEDMVTEEAVEPIPIVIKDSEIRRKIERLQFLSAPFQQHAYRPLQFRLTDGRIIEGIVDLVLQDEVLLKSYSGVVHPTKITELMEIKWRGKTF